MSKRTYKLGKTTFPSWTSKEHYVLEGQLMSLKYVYLTTKKNLAFTEKELMKLTIRQLKSQIVRFRKKLAKEGEFNPLCIHDKL